MINKLQKVRKTMPEVKYNFKNYLFDLRLLMFFMFCNQTYSQVADTNYLSTLKYRNFFTNNCKEVMNDTLSDFIYKYRYNYLLSFDISSSFSKIILVPDYFKKTNINELVKTDTSLCIFLSSPILVESKISSSYFSGLLKDTISIDKWVISKNAHFNTNSCEFENYFVHSTDYFYLYASDTVFFINLTKRSIVLNGCYFFEDIHSILNDSISSIIFDKDFVNFNNIVDCQYITEELLKIRKINFSIKKINSNTFRIILFDKLYKDINETNCVSFLRSLILGGNLKDWGFDLI